MHAHVSTEKTAVNVGLKRSFTFLQEVELLYDVLFELQALFTILQCRTTALMRAQLEVNRTIRILESLKTEFGEKE